MEKVLLSIAAIEETSTPEIAQAVIEESRARAHDGPPLPWFHKWANVALLAFSLLSATGTGCIFIYKGISEQAIEATKTAAKFKSIDEYIIKSQSTIERMAEAQRDLQMKAQTSLEDRAGIHRELGMLLQQEREGRNDVVKRLERIEDHLLQITKRP